MNSWPIRRKNREMPSLDAMELLRSATWGVLSMVTSDGAPYGVPLNYAFGEECGALIFHGGLVGRKWSWISSNPEACFTVIGKGAILPGRFTTDYASVMVFGTLHRVSDEAEVLRDLRLLAMRCQPEGADIERFLAGAAARTAVVRLKIEVITGKRH